MDRIEAGVAAAVAAIDGGPEGFHAASRAILTTDTRPKVVSLRFGRWRTAGRSACSGSPRGRR